MTFTSPLGLLALLAVPAVLVLHLFRRKFRERRVAALFLFAPDALTAPAGRRRSRLLRTPSLWLELLAALLLGLWLGGVDFGVSRAQRHLVFVLDGSASMAAIADPETGESTVDRVRARIEELVDDEPADTLITLITTGPRPSIIAGPRALRPSLDTALDQYEPWRPDHDAGPAWDLGLELAAGDDGLHFLSDRPAIELPPRYELHALGAAAQNAAILSARRRGGDRTDTLFVDVMSWGLLPTDEIVTVTTGTRELARRDVTLNPQKAVHLTLELPPTPAPVRVALSGRDSLDLDDAFILLPEPSRSVRIATEGLDEDTIARLQLQRIARALPQARFVEVPARAQLVFRPRAVALLPGRSEVVLRAIGDTTDPWIGPYLIERRHELATGITLDGVVWTAGRGELAGLPLALAGPQVLASVERLDASLRVHLNLDVGRSNLMTSPDWPILLGNLTKAVRDRLPGAVEVNVPVGGLIQWRETGDPQAVRALRLVDPSGALRRGRGARLVTWVAERPGIHTIRREEQELERFSVQFVDPHESDLRGASTAREEPKAEDVAVTAEAAPDSTGHGLEARLCALLLLLALVTDWWVLRPRAAVSGGGE